MKDKTTNPAPPGPAVPRTRTTAADVGAAALLAFGAAFESRRGGTGNTRRAWLTAIPVVIVNYVAFRAQLRFWQDHLSRADALLVSVALESIAVYWSYQAHQAVMADDSALRLKLAAYGMALVIGALNYSHYMHPHWRPTVAAVTFGMMSVISPWLWSANSRRSSRDALKARGLIEDHAVRLGLTRWFWHAWRCVQVMHKATWAGENRPAEAIRMYRARKDRIAARRAAGAQPYADVVPDVRKNTARRAAAAAAAQTPPPAPGPGEPRPAVVTAAGSRAKAPGEGLEAARTDAERALVRKLIEDGPPFPGRNKLAGDETLPGSEATRKRAAARVLRDVARAGVVNGSHD